MDKKKLNPLYNFLVKNRKFNKSLQENYYKSIIGPCEGVEGKVISLLYKTASTQSKPDIDMLASFFKYIHEDPSCLVSLSKFIQKFSGKNDKSFNELFLALKKQSGWGDKTSALFVKIIYHLHNGKYDKSLKIWNDVPLRINKDDSLKLPVDKVITHIFSEIGLVKPNFSKINELLNKHYKGREIEVWDDLWFWGFITQRGSGTNRKLEWNENKYWALEYSSKCPIEIQDIKEKSLIFIDIIRKSKDIKI